MQKVCDLFCEIEEKLKAFLDCENFALVKKSFAGEIPNNDCLRSLVLPCKDLVLRGGKRWRPALMVLSCDFACMAKKFSAQDARVAHDLVLSLVPLVEFCHTASLIHDDLEDSSESRRGKPCIHKIFGMDVAINSASWLYFFAASAISFSKLSSEQKFLVHEMYLQEMRNLHLGQAADIFWHKNANLIPKIEEYFLMVKNKTGVLSRFSLWLGFFCAGANENEIKTAAKFAEELGVGFQIADDVKNLKTGNPGKNRGDDIVEGKKSLPILIHLQKNPCDAQKFEQIFFRAKNEGVNSSAVEQAIEILQKSGAIIQAEKIANEKIEQSIKNLTNFFGKEFSKSENALAIKNLLEGLK